MAELLWRGAIIGIGATALMDVWALFLRLVFRESMPNWGFVGRWVWHLRGGKVFHDSIAVASPHPNEIAIGWAFHYLVGILYGMVLVVVMGPDWLAEPTFLPAFILGMLTIGAGWFLLAPGMGAGWAASRTPNPRKVRLMNFAAHCVFAIGLYGTAMLIR